MKEYPLTDSDLHDLRNIGAGATLFFALGSLCLGFWSNLYATLTFSADLPKQLLTVGTARQQDAMYAAIFCYAIAILLTVMGYTRISDIKAEVDFGDGLKNKYIVVIKRIVKIVLAAGLLVLAFWLGRKYT